MQSKTFQVSWLHFSHKARVHTLSKTCFRPTCFLVFHYLHTCLHDIIFQCLFSLVSSFLDILGMLFFQFLPTFFPCVTSNFIHVFSSLMFMCFIKCRSIFPCVFSHVHPTSLRGLIFFPAIFRFFSHFHEISSLFQHFPMVFPKFCVPFFAASPRYKACGVEDGASAAPASALPAAVTAVTALPPAVAMEARAEAWPGERWKIYGKYGGLLETYGKYMVIYG